MEKTPGYAGCELWVDLARKTATKHPLRKDLRGCIGGAGYAVRCLLEHQPPRLDPFHPESLLLFATGPLTDSRVPGGGSLEICCTSPLTGAWGESRMGCDAGIALRKAGVDVLVVTGAAAEPCVLFLDDGKVSFLSGAALLGKTTLEKERLVAEMVEDPSLLVLSIGPAGENLVRFASVMHRHRAAGRIGVGAVMGAKKLLALAVRGTGTVPLADPEAFLETTRRVHEKVLQHPMAKEFRRAGTMGGYVWSDASGDLPTKNWRSNSWGKGEAIFRHFMEENLVASRGCYRGCTLQCGRRVTVASGPFATPEHDGGEYESVAAFTAFVTNENVDAAVHASWLCNELGVDTISAGGAAAFLMECVERGISLPEDAQSLGLAWGNGAALAPLVRKIAFREGVGDLVADGVRTAAERLGRPEALAWAVVGKGLEGPAHDPRGGKVLALTYGTNPRGMCHIHPVEAKAWDGDKLDFGLQRFGLPDPEGISPWEERGKGLAARLLQDAGTLPEVLCTCKFYMYAGMTLDDYAAMLAAATGWDVSGEELLETGERIFTLQRLFNRREGFATGDDALHPRVRAMPEFGRYADDPRCAVADYEEMLWEYYAARGWDPETGIPTAETLRRLGLPSDLAGG